MNIEDFYVGNATDKPIAKNSAVNVIYFTNKCNLACTYCYEDLSNRPPQVLSKDDIRAHVDSVLEREDPNNQTLFVLFGGEPTLEWDNVCFLMEYAWSQKSNVRFNMTTNGIKYASQKFIDDTMSNKFYRMGLLSIDVSFDGIGNQERVLHNGETSTSLMLKVFTLLNKNKFRYRIRYTIQRNNIIHAYEDISRIIQVFRPDRLITSVAWDTLLETDLEILYSTKEQLRSDWINNKLHNVPVCDLFCDMCNGCGERKQLKTYFTDEGNVSTYKNHENSPPFHDFKNKEIIDE